MTDLGTWWRQLEGKALYFYHRTVARTLRWHLDGLANITLAESTKRPLLWTYWHEQVTPFIMYGDRFRDGGKFCVVVVGDERGDILSELGTSLGSQVYTIDMGGNPMASGRSLLRVIQAMKSGRETMLAPDGPDGPAFVPKGGVAFLARKAEAAVIPVGAYGVGAYRMPRWDKYQVPLPFTNMHMTFGQPILASRRDDDAELLTRITAALSQVRTRAQELAGIAPWP